MSNIVDFVDFENDTNNKTFNNNNELKNKGFSQFLTLVQKYSWSLIKNEINSVHFAKIGHETDCFEVDIDKNKIYVCFPLMNSKYKYVTMFDNYFLASEYFEARFIEFAEQMESNKL